MGAAFAFAAKPLNIARWLAYAAHMATHFASPHNRRAPQDIHGKMPPMQQEDIGAVLERFHKWAGQKQEPVRELTYEEAVARSRRRVYTEDVPLHTEPAKAAASPAPVAPPPPIPFPLVKDPPPKQTPAKPSGPSPRKTSGAGKKEVAEEKQGGMAPKEPAATRRKSAKTASSAKARTGKKASASTKSPVDAKPRKAQKKPTKKSAPRNNTATVPEPAQAPQATFEQVLAAQMKPPVLEPPPHAAVHTAPATVRVRSETAMVPRPPTAGG